VIAVLLVVVGPVSIQMLARTFHGNNFEIKVVYINFMFFAA
jgi:hypothetical protein